MLKGIFEKYSLLLNSKIIEIWFFNVVTLPRKYIRQLGWKKGDKLTAYLNSQENYIEISRKNDGEMEICKWRLITLPHHFCEFLGWTRRDKLKVTFDLSEGILRLSLHKKLKLKCQDCRTKDNVMLMNTSCFLDPSMDYGICCICLSRRRKRIEAFLDEALKKFQLEDNATLI